MAVNYFNILLKSVCTAFYQEENGGQLWIPDTIQGYVLADEAKEVLHNLVNLIMFTDYTKEDTKRFLSSKYVTYRSGERDNKTAENKNTSRSRIQYDLSKLKIIFGENGLEVIITKPGADISVYADKIAKLLEKHTQRSLLDNLTIDYPASVGYVMELDEDELEILKELIQHHSKKGKAMAKNKLTSKMIGYIERLETYDIDTEKDEEIYNFLHEWLN